MTSQVFKSTKRVIFESSRPLNMRFCTNPLFSFLCTLRSAKGEGKEKGSAIEVVDVTFIVKKLKLQMPISRPFNGINTPF